MEGVEDGQNQGGGEGEGLIRVDREASLTLLSNRLRGLTLRLNVMAAYSSDANRKWCCTSGKWTPFCSSASSAIDAGPSEPHHASSTDNSGAGASSTAESAWGE